MTFSAALAILTITLAVVGCVYQGFVVAALRGFFATPAPMASSRAAVTLLKPLYGDEPHLEANLASFLHSDHKGPIQMVLGTNSASDAALPAARALIAGHPGADIALSTGPAPPCANGKVGNLIAMAPLAAHDILVLSDSDMVVEPDYLPKLLATLDEPGVGIVSCAYVARGDTGFWSQLGAAMVNYQGMPNVILAVHHRLERPCMGATIALRRETLAAIGGFEVLRDTLADDYAMGAAVAALGLDIRVPPMLLVHASTERGIGELWRHFLRWAVTIRDLRPAGHYGSLVTQPLPLALIAMAFRFKAGLALVLVALAARLAVALAMRRVAPRPWAPLWLLPLADVFAFAVFFASLFARRVDWRGASLTMAGGGRIHARAGQ